MLSGVGPEAHLKSLRTPVVADIPQIGQNLQDHHFAFMPFEVNPNHAAQLINEQGTFQFS